MSRSLNSYQKEKIKENAAFTCAICNTRREKNLLEVHHKNSNVRHNYPRNLMVLCKDCHYDLHVTLGGGEREREKTIVIKNETDYQGGSVEMQVNEYAEMPFRNWLKAKIIKHTKYLKKQAIYSGAEVNNISPTTTRKYLEKMISDDGPLFEYKDMNDKKKYIRLKK